MLSKATLAAIVNKVNRMTKRLKRHTNIKIAIKSIRYKTLILLCFLFTSLLMPYLEPKTDKNPDITTA